MDEALDVARGICNGNKSAVLLVLCPLQYTKDQQHVVIKHRRTVEDKLLALPG